MSKMCAWLNIFRIIRRYPEDDLGQSMDLVKFAEDTFKKFE